MKVYILLYFLLYNYQKEISRADSICYSGIHILYTVRHFSTDPIYSEYDLGPDEFVPDQGEKTTDQSDKPMTDGGGDDQGSSGNDYKDMPPHPPLYVPSMKNAEYFSPVYNRTQPGITRTCRKSVDLYVLQPNRLNMSGSFNPLKGKLTNCHATGCERYYNAITYVLLFSLYIIPFIPTYLNLTTSK